MMKAYALISLLTAFLIPESFAQSSPPNSLAGKNVFDLFAGGKKPANYKVSEELSHSEGVTTDFSAANFDFMKPGFYIRMSEVTNNLFYFDLDSDGKIISAMRIDQGACAEVGLEKTVNPKLAQMVASYFKITLPVSQKKKIECVAEKKLCKTSGDQINPDIRSLIFEMDRRQKVQGMPSTQENWWVKNQKLRDGYLTKDKAVYIRSNEKHSVSQLEAIVKQSQGKDWDIIPENLNRGQVPENFVPSGRFNDGLKRDEAFRQNAVKVMDQYYQGAQNVFFINYTGHEGPVASALAKQNIPTKWQLSYDDERIANQISDWSADIQANTASNKKNVSLILEPRHALNPTLNPDLLPSLEGLKEKGIRKIAVFSEDPYTKTNETERYLKDNQWPDRGLYEYIQKAKRQGIEVVVHGLEYDNR